LGGDEFAILLPNSDATQASALVSRIKEHCLGLDPLWRAGTLGISAGIVEFRASESASEFIKRADAAMYNVKQVHRRQTPGK
jgi:diguanylate cyclase (GGDEF)-like protein